MARKLLELEQEAHYANDMVVQCKCDCTCLNAVPFITFFESCDNCRNNRHRSPQLNSEIL